MKYDHGRGLVFLAAVGLGSLITLVLPTWLFLTTMLVIVVAVVYLLGALV